MKTVQRFIAANSYYSKTFSIVTENEAHEAFTISVYDERDRHLVEFHRDLSMDDAERLSEKLKTKYIFDYQKALVANQTAVV
jgi:hypothetical protein